MDADYSFYVKSIATRAPTFFGYIISVLANVVRVVNYQQPQFDWELLRGAYLTQEKTHVKTFRGDIPVSLVCLSLTELDKLISPYLSHSPSMVPMQLGTYIKIQI